MPILKDFERRLEGLVEGFFAKTFRSGLQPVELAKRLLREQDAGKTLGPRGEVWGPNRFVFTLSPVDRDRFGQAEDALASELGQVVREGAAERGLGLVGPPEMEFATDEGLGKGRFRCEASLVAGEDLEADRSSTSASPRARSVLVLIEDGAPAKEFALTKQAVSIGRLPECDVQVSDPGASRRHAEVHVAGDEVTLLDLGSTNGTLVNNKAVHGPRALEDGDLITIGETVLEFRRR